MMFREVIINEINLNIIKEINVKIIEIIRELIKIKKSYLKDSLSYSTYA